MATDLAEWEAVDEEQPWEAAPSEYPRDLTMADLPGFYQSPERMRAASVSGAGPYEAGTELTAAIGGDVMNLSKNIGTGLHEAGEGVSDFVKAATFMGIGEEDLAAEQMLGHKTRADQRLEDPEEFVAPWTAGKDQLPFVPRALSSGVEGLLQTAPQLGIAALNPIAGAISFGFTPEGFDPVPAALGLAAPFAGKVGGKVAQYVAGKLGVTSETLLKAAGMTGGAGTAAVTMTAPEIRHVLSMEPGPEQDKAIADLAGNMGVMAILGLHGESSNERSQNARNIPEATEVHGNVRPQPVEGAGKVPAEEGGTRVQRNAQTEANAPRETPLKEHELEELNQLQGMKKSGRLSYEDAQRLDTLEAMHDSGMNAIERGLLDEAKDEFGKDFEVRKELEGNEPFSGQIATIDRARNKVVINPKEFRLWLQEIPEGQRQEAVRTLMAEETIHLATSDAHARDYWDSMTWAEKRLAMKRYTGKWSGETLTGVKVSEQDFGHEALRARIQQLNGMDPTEVASMAGREKWTMKAVTALENAIYGLRKTLGTDASKVQLDILDRVQKNLDVAKSTLAGGAPGAIRRSQWMDKEGNLGKEEDTNPFTEALFEKFDPNAKQYMARADRGHSDTRTDRTGKLDSRVHQYGELIKRGNARVTSDESSITVVGDLTIPQRRKLIAKAQEEGKTLTRKGVGSAGDTVLYQPHGESTPGAIRIKGDASDSLNEFVQEFMKEHPKITNDSRAEGAVTTRKTGMGLKSTSDLDALVSLKENLGEQIKTARAEAMKDPSKMAAYAALAGRGQWLREVAEFATDTGSWQESLRNAHEEAAPNRPLDWKKNPEVRKWIEENGSKLGIKLPESEASTPGAIRRGGEKLDDEIKSLRKEITDSKGSDFAYGLHELLTQKGGPEMNGVTVQQAYDATLTPEGNSLLRGILGESADKFIEQGRSHQEKIDRLRELEYKQFNLKDRPGQQSFPAAIRRGGMSKKASEVAEQKRRIAEMFAKSRGEELPPELQSKAKPSEFAPVPAEERVGASESGAMPSISGKDLEAKATEILGGAIDITKDQRPSYEEFSKWAKRNMQGVKDDQIRDLWEDRVWGSLLNAEPQRLESWRKVLGLERNYGSRPIVEKAPPEGFKLETNDKVLARQNKLTAESKQRYRNKIIGAIARRLVGESTVGRKSLERDNIDIEDVDFASRKAQQEGKPDIGPYHEINKDDLATNSKGVLERLYTILRDQARGRRSDPESASRRALAVVGKDGKVHLLSTYNDAGVQRVVDPAGGGQKSKPYRELNKTFLNQYRPIASLLLTDPIKGLRQKFETVSEFNDKIGKEAGERSRIGDWEAVPEGPASEDFHAEGTEGIEGEGGSFMGPGKQAVSTTGKGTALESDVPLTTREARAMTDYIKSEAGDIDSQESVLAALDGLSAAAKAGKMTPKERLALNAFRKIFNQVGNQKGSDNPEGVIGHMASSIADSFHASKWKEENFVKNLVNLYGKGYEEPTSSRRGFNLPTQLQKPVETGPAQRFGGAVPKKAGEAPGITGTMGPGMEGPPKAEKFEGIETGEQYSAESEAALDRNLEVARTAATVNRAKLIRQRYWRKNKTLMPWEHAWKLAGGGPNPFGSGPGAIRRSIARAKIGKRLTDMVADLGSSYDEWMVDRIERDGGVVAQQMAPVFRRIIDRSKQLYGSLAKDLDKAKAMAGGSRQRGIVGQLPSRESLKASTWLHGLEKTKGSPLTATSRTVDAIEGRGVIPSFAQRVVQAARDLNLRIGQMVEPVVSGFQSSGNFVDNMTPFAKKLLNGGQNKMWKHWADTLAMENGTSKRAAQRALSKLKNDLDSARTPGDIIKANQDFLTAMPSPVLAFDYGGKRFNMAKNYQASGKFARNITATAYDAILKGSGFRDVNGVKKGSANIWDKWMHGLAKANGMSLDKTKQFFREFKATLDKEGVSSSDIERINQDFTRVFPKVITHVFDGGQWHEVVHSNLFNYLENAAQRAAHIRAFREEIPNNVAGQQVMKTISEDMMAEMGPKGKTALKAMLKTMQGLPTDNYSSWGALSPTEKAGQAFRLANSTIGNVMAKSALTMQMFVQPGELATGATPMFLGYKNYVRAMAKASHMYGWMEEQGMVNRVMHDFSFDPNSPVRSSFRIAGNAISKGFGEQFFNEMQEALAASTAKVVADRITNKTLDKWELRMLPETFKAMGFGHDEVAGLMQGNPELLGQFQRKAAAFLTSGNKAISEGSKLGANRLFNSIFRFQAYPMMKMNQFRKVGKSFLEAWQGGTAGEKRASTEQMARFIAGSVAQGAITAGLTTLAFSGPQGVKVKANEAMDDPLDFLSDMFLATVSGPAYVAWRGLKSKGVRGLGESATRMMFPYTVATELSDFATGSGRYGDKDQFGKIGEFVKARVPGTRAIGTGMSMMGLSKEDKALDASLDGLYRWKRDTMGFIERKSFLEEDSHKAFRVQMGKAVNALKSGDEDGFLKAYEAANEALVEKQMGDIEKGKEPTAESVGESLRRKTVLRNAEGGKLSMDEMEALRKHIGDDAVDRLEWFDAMIESAADGEIVPRFDD